MRVIMTIFALAVSLAACASLRSQSETTAFTIEPDVWLVLSNFGGGDWRRVACEQKLCARSSPDSMMVQVSKTRDKDVSRLVPGIRGHRTFEEGRGKPGFIMGDSMPFMMETVGGEILVWIHQFTEGGMKQSLAVGCADLWCAQFTIATHEEVEAFARRLFRGVSFGKRT